MADDPLSKPTSWPVGRVGWAIVEPDQAADQRIAPHGDPGEFALASLTKPMSAWAIMVATEEGIVDLDTPLAPTANRPLSDGTTLRHLLAHAAGFPFEGDPISPIERTRTYSNTGIEVAAAIVADAADMAFADYLAAAVFEPLGMTSTVLRGSPAHGASSTVADMARFVNEMLRPQLLAASTHREVVTVQYPDLGGIVPGVGRFDPCPWGLGVEVHGAKAPHWMAERNSPSTVGHFGGAGTMMWADPVADVGVVALTDRPYGEWAATALRAWPAFSAAVLDASSKDVSTS